MDEPERTRGVSGKVATSSSDGEHGQAERAGLVLGERAQDRQEAQHPVQGWLVRLYGPRQLLNMHRASREKIRQCGVGTRFEL